MELGATVERIPVCARQLGWNGGHVWGAQLEGVWNAQLEGTRACSAKDVCGSMHTGGAPSVCGTRSPVPVAEGEPLRYRRSHNAT